jgi:hypothetical protein
MLPGKWVSASPSREEKVIDPELELSCDGTVVGASSHWARVLEWRAPGTGITKECGN